MTKQELHYHHAVDASYIWKKQMRSEWLRHQSENISCLLETRATKKGEYLHVSTADDHQQEDKHETNAGENNGYQTLGPT